MESNKLVWYPDAARGYCVGRIVDIASCVASVEPVALPAATGAHLEVVGAGEPALEFAYASLYPCNQLELRALREGRAGSGEAQVDADDSCALVQLHEAALLDNVRVRFHRDKIYTYVAHILIAVNPYRRIAELHSADAIARYQGRSLGTLPPHVYAIADKAYRDMKAFKRSQSIIISGESGAGKTESQKYVLRYLCLSGSQSGRLEKLILDANPLLEAFGNAKTIRNNNSSRFGKFIEIHYSHKFTVTGGLFLHYLLEKSRICTQAPGERNYHIFYQLAACLPEAEWTRLRLRAPDHFRYLASGCTQYFCGARDAAQVRAERQSEAQRRLGAIHDQLIDDVKCFEQTERALSNFGVSEQRKRDMYAVVAAVLHLGNIAFLDDPDDNRGGCRVEPGAAEEALDACAHLMGLDADLLRQALTTRIMSTGRAGHKGTVYMVRLSAQQAQQARDALAKAIYSRLFDHIVAKIVNTSIPFASSAYYIGVLDVAGFEYFQHNSFEQFLINFCNEKLQQFFNERILKEEQTIYDKEGLALERVEFVDNEDCIALFEAKSAGIFDLLDEESRLPKPSAVHFTQSVHSRNAAHFRLAVPRASKLRAHREIRDDEGFLVRHFAGAVCYETGAFIDKNNDALHGSLRSLMLDASHELLRDLFADADAASAKGAPPTPAPLFTTSGAQTSGAGANKLNFVSVATTFRCQLNELMGKLRATGSHFIRCIKPNSDMVARKLEGAQCLSQLHCSGMDSVLRLMQCGYPSRVSFHDLYATYRQMLPAELARLDAHLFCRALFKALGLRDSDFRFGSSKVFFRPAKFAEFDAIVREDGEHVAALVRTVARWLVRWRWRKAQYCALCAIKLHRKILYRRELIVHLQRQWRWALAARRFRFRLAAVRSARALQRSLADFRTIVAEQLSSASERQLLEQQAHLLRDEIDAFVAGLSRDVHLLLESRTEANNNSPSGAKLAAQSLAEQRESCQRQLDTLSTKRDLLVRSIKDKLAKQRELLELERQVRDENKRREQQQVAQRRDEQVKQQRTELELRRQAEVRHQQQQQRQADRPRLVDAATDPMAQADEQERRDLEIALRLARDAPTAGNPNAQLDVTGRARRPLAPPSHNHAADTPDAIDAKYDLTKWKYSDLRDTINTSCDLELLEACKREFHRRLKVYHAWRAMNSRQAQGSEQSVRAPQSIIESASAGGASGPLADAASAHEHRYFRIPFVKGQSGSRRGWWFAHFDGQWIARQLELHPDREPILLIAGQHDIEMCELSLRETRLTSKRGAEILPQEFEEEWTKHGGQPYARHK